MSRKLSEISERAGNAERWRYNSYSDGPENMLERATEQLIGYIRVLECSSAWEMR